MNAQEPREAPGERRHGADDGSRGRHNPPRERTGGAAPGSGAQAGDRHRNQSGAGAGRHQGGSSGDRYRDQGDRADRRSADDRPRSGGRRGDAARTGGRPNERDGGFRADRNRNGGGRGPAFRGGAQDRRARPHRDNDNAPARQHRDPEPDLPDDVAPDELDTSVRRDLHTLDRANAETVARHLVMAGRLVDTDPTAALAHARAARGRAGRVAAVREAAGISAYHAGEWAEALSELRAARRMAGGPGMLAVMADCERGLGRPERALDLARSEEARRLTGEAAIELNIVVAGARMDMGKYDAAVVTLQGKDLDPAKTGSAYARLFYVYAEALLAAGREREALEWFLNCAAADDSAETDAEERVAELSADGPGADGPAGTTGGE
ncbi:hypothetical protein [Tomitella fengzijianii]|uniref:hypothetical protein n=1 Tax=Tomitella fengzijianii TaxID=2597660 RepID=UPI001E5B3594|nr:hypothetical protein [Tomitella fengzijianii]